MPRHESWARFRGGEGSDGSAQSEGRLVLGDLLNQLDLGGISVGKLTRTLRDGTVIIASHDGTTPTVTTIAPLQVTPTQVEPDLWIPQGIVCAPASNDAPAGWGLPATMEGVDPGPLVAAWSPNGALPQVLLSRVADAGYPDNPAESTPLYWDEFEAPADDVDVQQEGASWAAYRIRFRDLGTSFDSLLEEINSRRAVDQPLCGPFAGYADIAVEYGSVVLSFGADETNYPIGARTNFRRIEKEGTVRTTDTNAAFGQIGAGTLPPDLSVSQIVDALVGVQPQLIDSTFKCGSSFSIVGAAPFFTALIDHTDEWVHCGNIDWLSIHEEVPRLSWFGSRGRSIPSWELGTGVSTTTAYDGTFSPPTAFSTYWLDTTETNFQGAKLKQFGRCIYARGRILAQLPNEGYVLGAAIQRIDATSDAAARYLLVAIGWHRSEQKLTEQGSPPFDSSAPLGVFWDASSDVHTWLAELPTRDGLVCAPEYVVDGLFDEATNPRGWRDIARHRLTTTDPAGLSYWLGDFPDRGTDYPTDAEFGAPKGYWQTWMFNGSGTQATCMRCATYNLRHPISHALVSTGPVGPVQAIRCSIDESTSFVQIVWQTAEGVVFDIGDPFPYAWDYVGDDEAVAWFEGADDGGGNIELAIENTAGGALVSWTYPGDTSSIVHAFDARTNTGIIAAYAFDGTEFTSDEISVFHAGQRVLHIIAPIAGGVGLGYGGWGNAFTYMTAPIWNQIGGNVGTLPTIAVYDDDYIAALWDGAQPGAPQGAQPYHAETNFVRVASLTVSSIDDIETLLDVPSGWLNFAGVC